MRVGHDQSPPRPPGLASRIRRSRFEGPDVALGGRRLLEAQHAGGLGVAQLLEVAQGQDLAVERVHAVERLLEADAPLGADGRLAGAGVAAQELRRQGGGGRRGQGAAVERDLAGDVAHLGAEVLAVHPHEPLAGEEPQPEEERHVRLPGVLGQPGGGVDVGLLDDIGGIDPALQAAVEPQRDHPPQAVARPHQQGAPGRLVPLCRPPEQASRLARFAGHGSVHGDLTAPAARTWTGKIGAGPGFSRRPPLAAAPRASSPPV